MKRKTAASSTDAPGQDKDFAYLVRRAEAELGWMGKYDHERGPRPKYSRTSLRREVSFWHNKATDVRDNLEWMQKQLMKELEMPNASFGTKRNATVASMESLHAIVVDESEIGQNLRDYWFESLATNFKKMMLPLTQREIKMLREYEPRVKFVKDLRQLFGILKKQKLPYDMIQSTLGFVDPPKPKRSGKKGGVEEECAHEEASSSSGSQGSDEEDDAGGETAGNESEESGDGGGGRRCCRIVRRRKL